jgi:hypothetical protein
MVGVEDGFDYSAGPDAPRNGPEGSHLAEGSRQTISSHLDVISRETPGENSPLMWTHAHLNGVGDETNDGADASAFLSEKKLKSILRWLGEVDSPTSDADPTM